ncbi:MAG: TatD family nuclease-associated radical SAM protein [Candidatus Gastranaerophilales bacterium]|nr:TatD family nuclease-associated radical SAM protein [Candidatus Gastranaerophilales bacterium]
MQNLLYFLYEKAYINITNACTNACGFCVRNIKDDVKGAKLWLEDKNAKAEDVILQIKENKEKIAANNELIFCGYGEPLANFEEVKKVCKYVKENMPDVKIRINTNGHGNFINKRNILPELVILADSISISLNAQNEELYNKISNPKIKNAYQEMLSFAKIAVLSGIDTTMSIVTGFKPDEYKINVSECEKIAREIGAKFRNREWISEGY